MRRLMLLFTACTAVLISAPGATGGLASFRTPSGNIGCVYQTNLGPGAPPAELRCDIRSRLRPRPPKPPKCDLDWGDSYDLAPTGRAVLTCHGDTALDPHAHVLGYGSRWRRGAFSCSSATVGLTCRNRSGHGFFLSRKRSYRF